MSDTFDRIKGIVVDLLGVDPNKVTPEARFREDLEADSLDLVELIMAIEEEFDGTISDEEADLAMARLKADYSPATFTETLLDHRLTQSVLRDEVRDRLIIERLIEQAVTARIDVSDNEVAAFYEKHRDTFKRPVQVRAQQIVVKTEEQAKEIRRRVRRGGNFAECIAFVEKTAKAIQTG